MLLKHGKKKVPVSLFVAIVMEHHLIRTAACSHYSHAMRPTLSDMFQSSRTTSGRFAVSHADGRAASAYEVFRLRKRLRTALSVVPSSFTIIGHREVHT